MNPTTTKMVYVPPRPNLGPEPLPEPSPAALAAIGLGLALLLSLAVLLAWRRRRRRRARRPAAAAVRPGVPAEGLESPRERMIAWSVAIRESLAARFGPGWRAKTTEEIAGDPRLPSALGLDRTARLLDFLAAADRVKYADPDLDVVLDVPEGDLRELTEFVANAGPEAAANARTRAT